MKPNDKLKEIEHHIPTTQRKRLAIGFLVGTKQIEVIQPEKPQDTLTLLNNRRIMDFSK